MNTFLANLKLDTLNKDNPELNQREDVNMDLTMLVWLHLQGYRDLVKDELMIKVMSSHFCPFYTFPTVINTIPIYFNKEPILIYLFINF